jgi:predicted Co/Zn/Cd cation transporter (cation efflux family)
MIVLAGLVLGAVFGAFTAIRRGGRKLDALQYAAGYGIVFALICLFVSIILARIMAG